MIKHNFFVVSMIILMLSPVPAKAQDFYDKNVRTRINQIERQMQTLSRYIYRLDPEALKERGLDDAVNDLARVPTELIPDGSPDAGSAAELQVRLDAVENDVRKLTGQLEEQNYLLGLIGEKLEKIEDEIPATKDLNAQASERQASIAPTTLRRLNALEDQMKTIQNTMTKVMDETTRIRANNTVSEYSGTEPQVQETPDDIIADTFKRPQPSEEAKLEEKQHDSRTPNGLYQQAFDLLQNGDYNKAQVAFNGYLETYPQHDLVDNAKYWMAETHYVQKDYQKAARMFAKAYQDAPNSQKAPDNLLKLALSLAALDKKADACVTLKQMENGFTDLRAPLERRMKAEQERLDCL